MKISVCTLHVHTYPHSALPFFKCESLEGDMHGSAAAGHDGVRNSETFKILRQCKAQVLLEWRQLDCVLAGKKGGRRELLKGLEGRARPGRLLCIMGPSGSGKTTLLNALAGQLPAAAGLTLSGAVTVNGRARDAVRVRQAYVQQEDLFYSQLTVRCAPRVGGWGSVPVQL